MREFAQRTGAILFYDRDKPYYEFTNFSPHGIQWEDKRYPTAEHLFQAHKFFDTAPLIAEEIRHLSSARDALAKAGRHRDRQRADWFTVNIGVMDAVLHAKFTQHLELRELLLGTQEAELIEDSPVDAFWGWGSDGMGSNELGRALMRLRERLRASI
ncbi:DUF1768-domain-containing protein [Fomitopsis betulina]|nr:DUF1768-domain-containing protein [Fomitopsis betulina]KAI0716068.1 DUF1768-domain-containing protein [Fomitopsis betulina]